MKKSELRGSSGRLVQAAGAALLVLLLVLLSPIVLVGVMLYGLWSLALYVAIWSLWCPRGRYVLFVSSDSPIWRDYVEREILPKLQGRAVILNWSQRKRWNRSLAVAAFRHFGGDRAFNPLAVVFRPFRFARTFRFFEPFQEFKRGRPEKVESLKERLFDTLDGLERR
jgi:hypothetical protein